MLYAAVVLVLVRSSPWHQPAKGGGQQSVRASSSQRRLRHCVLFRTGIFCLEAHIRQYLGRLAAIGPWAAHLEYSTASSPVERHEQPAGDSCVSRSTSVPASALHHWGGGRALGPFAAVAWGGGGSALGFFAAVAGKGERCARYGSRA